MAISVINNNVMNLTRSLEKILDECSASGELKLANRKLKDFPKYYGKFNLSDTVFAGKQNHYSFLSHRCWFCGIIYGRKTCFFPTENGIKTSKNKPDA